MTININLLNFKNVKAIKQIIQIIKFYFEKKISVSKKIKRNSTQIFIENFYEKDVKKILKLKEEKKIKIIVLLTEFFEGDGLNQNTKISVINKKFNIFVYFIKLFNFGFLLKIKKFIKNNLGVFFISLKKIFYISFNKNIENLNMHRRRKNLEKLIPYVDLFLVAHPEIKKKLRKYYKINSFELTPILPQIKKNYSRENKIKFSGNISKYRYNEIFKIGQFVYNFNKYFKKPLNRNYQPFFLDINSNKRFKFSLHLKKDYCWSYDSPFRYFYAIIKNEIPIIMENFSHKNTKLVTLKLNDLNKTTYYKILKNYKSIIHSFNIKITKFNVNAKQNKLKFEKQLKNLL